MAERIREDGKPKEPNIGRLEAGLFKLYSGMSIVVDELNPDEVATLGPLRPLRMARAVEQANNGGITDPTMIEELEKARRLKAIFDRLIRF